MAAVNGSSHTKHNNATHRARIDRSASARLGNKAREVVDDLHDMGTIAKDAAQDTLEQLRESATDQLQQGKKKVQKLENSIEDYIRERPLKSILIAAGVGLLLGRIWLRR